MASSRWSSARTRRPSAPGRRTAADLRAGGAAGCPAAPPAGQRPSRAVARVPLVDTLGAELPTEGRLPGFSGASGWLNSPPLDAAGLLGRVVLVDFWTYTCINWLRTLPYVRAWHEKYVGEGLVVVGVHTPEFPFEHDPENVRWAAHYQRVDYPIALDPDFAV